MPKRNFKLESSLYPAPDVAVAIAAYAESGFSVAVTAEGVEIDVPEGQDARAVFDEFANYLLALRAEGEIAA